MGILKDTIIGYSTLSLHRRPDLYPPHPHPHALAFDPDRWQYWQPQAGHYTPFGMGPRVCVGQQFALTEIAYTAVRILQRFATVAGPEPADEPGLKAEIVLQPAAGVRLRFHTAA